MAALFSIAQGMVSSIVSTSGLSAMAAATIVWNYVGELIFNMMVLVGAVKMSDRLIRELIGLG